MNRLEKKCLLGSAAMHTLLVVVFLFGSAFLPKRAKPDKPIVLEIVPFNAIKFTDGPSRGGRPDVAPPPAPKVQAPIQAAVPPALPPKVEKPEKPEKPVETVKKEPAPPTEPIHKPKGDDPERVKASESNLLARLTKVVVKRPSEQAERDRARAEAREQAARTEATAARKRQALDGAISVAANRLEQGLSGKVASSVGIYGPGGGGPAVANWRSAVVDIYTRAWDPPPDASSSAKVGTRITVARDGTVLSPRITRPSGDSALDQSVERVLQRVKSVPALPEGAAEDQRTLNIVFDLTVKRSLG